MPSAHRKRKKKSNLLFYLFLLFLSVPLTLALASQQQQTRSNAAATITINGDSSPTPEATASKTMVKLILLLHGVGKGGDNTNPSSNSLSNKDPKHPQRLLNLQVINNNNEMVSATNTPLTYNKDQGTFESSVNLPTVPTGSYTLKVKTDRYLRRTVPGAVQITADHTTNVPSLELVAGDTNGDNSLDILDYNALLDCGYGELNPKTNGDQTSLFKSSTCQVHTPTDNVDIDDNNVINSIDYNLFLRELSVQNGD